jgi:hypothetical protein
MFENDETEDYGQYSQSICLPSIRGANLQLSESRLESIQQRVRQNRMQRRSASVLTLGTVPSMKTLQHSRDLSQTKLLNVQPSQYKFERYNTNSGKSTVIRRPLPLTYKQTLHDCLSQESTPSLLCGSASQQQYLSVDRLANTVGNDEPKQTLC